ncbi:MAG: DUF2780 domain-containing protein [Gammaproteobacteria bacterium]
MNTKKMMTVVASIVYTSVLAACAGAGGPYPQASGQTGQLLGTASQTLQTGQQVVDTAQALQSTSLTGVLVQQLGVTPTQAQSGAGALFQLAKDRMQAEAFAKVEQSVPGMQEMLGAARQIQQSTPLGGALGSVSGMPGLSGSTAGNVMAVTSLFQQQGMSPAMVQQFIPVMVNYVTNTGGSALANTLNSALLGQ